MRLPELETESPFNTILQAGIQALRQCQQQVQRLALFSSNEDAEDITSAGEAMAPHMPIIGVVSGPCQQQSCIT